MVRTFFLKKNIDVLLAIFNEWKTIIEKQIGDRSNVYSLIRAWSFVLMSLMPYACLKEYNNII